MFAQIYLFPSDIQRFNVLRTNHLFGVGRCMTINATYNGSHAYEALCIDCLCLKFTSNAAISSLKTEPRKRSVFYPNTAFQLPHCLFPLNFSTLQQISATTAPCLSVCLSFHHISILTSHLPSLEPRLWCSFGLIIKQKNT